MWNRSMITARQLRWSRIKCVIQSVLKHQYCIWLGPLMDVWLRWNHQPAVIILHCFLERLASMKSSACGQYYALVLVSLRWNNSIYLVYNILFLLQSVSKTISIIMSVYGKIYWCSWNHSAYLVYNILFLLIISALNSIC